MITKAPIRTTGSYLDTLPNAVPPPPHAPVEEIPRPVVESTASFPEQNNLSGPFNGAASRPSSKSSYLESLTGGSDGIDEANEVRPVSYSQVVESTTAPKSSSYLQGLAGPAFVRGDLKSVAAQSDGIETPDITEKEPPVDDVPPAVNGATQGFFSSQYSNMDGTFGQRSSATTTPYPPTGASRVSYLDALSQSTDSSQDQVGSAVEAPQIENNTNGDVSASNKSMEERTDSFFSNQQTTSTAQAPTKNTRQFNYLSSLKPNTGNAPATKVESLEDKTDAFFSMQATTASSPVAVQTITDTVPKAEFNPNSEESVTASDSLEDATDAFFSKQAVVASAETAPKTTVRTSLNYLSSLEPNTDNDASTEVNGSLEDATDMFFSKQASAEPVKAAPSLEDATDMFFSKQEAAAPATGGSLEDATDMFFTQQAAAASAEAEPKVNIPQTRITSMEPEMSYPPPMKLPNYGIPNTLIKETTAITKAEKEASRIERIACMMGYSIMLPVAAAFLWGPFVETELDKSSAVNMKPAIADPQLLTQDPIAVETAAADMNDVAERQSGSVEASAVSAGVVPDQSIPGKIEQLSSQGATEAQNIAVTTNAPKSVPLIDDDESWGAFDTIQDKGAIAVSETGSSDVLTKETMMAKIDDLGALLDEEAYTKALDNIGTLRKQIGSQSGKDIDKATTDSVLALLADIEGEIGELMSL